MIHCQKCRRFFEFSSHDRSATCPNCGHSNRPETDSEPWVPVARLTNLAEVGYFEAILTDHGIETVVQRNEDYDAVSGTWSHWMVMQVAAEDADRAAELIEAELERTNEDSADEGRFDSAEFHGPPLALRWKPVALILIVAAAAYWTVLVAPRLLGRAQHNSDQSLWDALAESSRPLSSQTPPGEPKRTLYFDRAIGRLLLVEDLDGDGRIDRRREFSAEKLIFDQRR